MVWQAVLTVATTVAAAGWSDAASGNGNLTSGALSVAMAGTGYRIDVEGEPWFTSGATEFSAEGKTFSTADGTLAPAGTPSAGNVTSPSPLTPHLPPPPPATPSHSQPHHTPSSAPPPPHNTNTRPLPTRPGAASDLAGSYDFIKQDWASATKQRFSTVIKAYRGGRSQLVVCATSFESRPSPA